MTNDSAPIVTQEENTACPPAPRKDPVVLVVRGLSQEHEEVLGRIVGKYQEVFEHEGYGRVCIEMRFLKRHQKEVIIHCGKDYRYVVDFEKAQSTT